MMTDYLKLLAASIVCGVALTAGAIYAVDNTPRYCTGDVCPAAVQEQV